MLPTRFGLQSKIIIFAALVVISVVGVSTGDEAVNRRLQVIEKQIEDIVRTVKQLLSWTRGLDLRLEPDDLRHILEETVLLSSSAKVVSGANSAA